MRKSIVALFLSLFLMTGCVSQTVKEKLSSNAAKLDGYVQRMDAGETTPEEDQDLIRAQRIFIWSANRAENGETPPPDVLLILEQGRN